MTEMSNPFGVRGAAGHVVAQVDETPRTEQELIRMAQRRTPGSLVKKSGEATRYLERDDVECPALRQLARAGLVLSAKYADGKTRYWLPRPSDEPTLRATTDAPAPPDAAQANTSDGPPASVPNHANVPSSSEGAVAAPGPERGGDVSVEEGRELIKLYGSRELAAGSRSTEPGRFGCHYPAVNSRDPYYTACGSGSPV